MIHFATKADIVNLMNTNREEMIFLLKIIYDTPDDTLYRVVSGSEDTGDVVYEEVDSPFPIWKQKGFLTRAEIKDFIGDYGDEVLNIAKNKKLQNHQDHITQSVAAYNTRQSAEIVAAAKTQAFIDNLPSWDAVNTAVTNISNLADAKAFIRKLARIVYWIARDRQD